MVPHGALEKLPEPHDAWQGPAFQRVAVQQHRQQARRRHGQLPGTQRAAPGGRRRGDGAGAFQRAAGGAGAGRLREGVQRRLVAQAQTGHRGHRHLLGRGGTGWHRRHCGAQCQPADALLGAGCGGHPVFAGLFQSEPGGHRPAVCAVPAAERPHRQRAGRAPLHPRCRAGHQHQERGGGLVL